ncbi:MAG: hypothetical protein PHE84_04560 [bacterium]|nr:hypothetical protein [bacterium]
MFNVEDYIPHRGRIRMIEEILEVDENTCRARARVLDTWPLVDAQNAGIIIIIELVAQTVAFSVGWNQKNKVKPGGPGVIVGIKEATFFAAGIPVGDTVTLTAKKLVDRDNYGTFSGTAFDGDRILGNLELQVYRI